MENVCSIKKMENRNMTPIKDPAESIVLEFDFSSELGSVDSATVAVTVHGDGVDPSALSMIDGAVQISGASVYQRISNGVAGVNYKLKCLAVSGSDIIARSDVMPVRTA